MKGRSILVLYSLILLGTPLFAQPDEFFLREEDPLNRRGKFYMLPEAGLWWGTYTNIEVAPQLGFHITDRISIGVGPHYIYYKNNDYYSPVHFSTHIWGIKTFSRITLIKDAAGFLPIRLFDELFAHVEFELMNLENRYFNAPAFPDEGRFWMDYLYVGGGFSQRMGPNASYYLMLLWNLNQSYNSLYINPTYRVGFCFYF